MCACVCACMHCMYAEEEESKYIALAPVQRSRKVLPKPQPPPQPAEEDSSDASDSPTENESAPALRQRSSTIGPRAEGADAGEGVSDGEQEDTVRDQRKPVCKCGWPHTHFKSQAQAFVWNFRHSCERSVSQYLSVPI